MGRVDNQFSFKTVIQTTLVIRRSFLYYVEYGIQSLAEECLLSQQYFTPSVGYRLGRSPEQCFHWSSEEKSQCNPGYRLQSISACSEKSLKEPNSSLKFGDVCPICSMSVPNLYWLLQTSWSETIPCLAPKICEIAEYYTAVSAIWMTMYRAAGWIRVCDQHKE